MDMHRRAAHEGAAALDSGDTAFVIISSILVLLMTLPGLMLFYGALTARGTLVNELALGSGNGTRRPGRHHLIARVWALCVSGGRARCRVRAFLHDRWFAGDAGSWCERPLCALPVAPNVDVGRS